MPVDKAINKAAASAWILVKKAIDEAIDAAVLIDLMGELGPLINKTASEMQSKMIIMGQQISSCHVPVVRSFFHLAKDVVIIFKYSIWSPS